jgi:hypothetical protein
MNGTKAFCRRYLRYASAGILILGGVSLSDGDPTTLMPRIGAGVGDAALAQTPAVQPLSANDISWLFPPPTQASDFAKLISMRDLTSQNPQDPTKRDLVWSEVAFQQFLAIAGSPASLVSLMPLAV